jgi:hypothetical protein
MLEEARKIVAAIHKTVQHQLPITMVGAGLPQIAELAGEAKSYAERLFKFPEIGILTDQDARAALQEPAADEGAIFDEAAVQLATEITGRYPYFIQSSAMPYGKLHPRTGSRELTSSKRSSISA